MDKLFFRVRNYFQHPEVFKAVVLQHLSPIFTDRQYIRLNWKIRMPGLPLNLDNPKRFTEKLQWLKLHDRKPIYTVMVDKLKVKSYITEKIGSDYVAPVLGVWNNVDEIDWESLPDKFVIKCSHDSGGMVICKDKTMLNIVDAKRLLKKCMKVQYYWKSREWPYKNVERKIFAEQYMEDEYGELRDYKWFCFNGVPKALFIAADRTKGTETTFDFYDADFNHLPFTNGHPNAKVPQEKPRGFEEMKRLAAELSKGIPQLRVDFYDINGRVYFGEFTFFHWGGMMPFVPDEWDYTFGSWLHLPTDEQ